MRIVIKKEEENDEMPQRFWLFGPSFAQSPIEVKREEERDVLVEQCSDNPPSLLEAKKRACSVRNKVSSSKKARVETPKNGSSSKKIIKNRPKKSKIGKKAKAKLTEDGNEKSGLLVDVKIENSEILEQRMGGRRKSAALSIIKTESDANVKIENGESLKGGSGKRGTGSTNRWTKERYTRAEEVVLGLMKENGGPPLVRRELRDMARKKIGDTGLLDHLLKHMAGKVVGDGGERFMRGYNEDGVMFYWLESAGSGDGRTGRGFCRCGDGCVEEIRGLKEGIATLNWEMDQLRSSKETEEIAWKEKYERLLDTNIQLEVQMAKVKNNVQGLKDKYEKLLRKNVKLEAEIEGISNSYQGLKDEMLSKEEKGGDVIAEEMETIEDDKRESDSEGGDVNHDNMLEHFKVSGSSQMRRLKLTCRGLLKKKCLTGPYRCEGELPRLPSSSESDQLTSQQILD